MTDFRTVGLILKKLPRKGLGLNVPTQLRRFERRRVPVS